MKIFNKRIYANHNLEIAFSKLSYKKEDRDLPLVKYPLWLVWVANLVRGPRLEI